MTSPTVWADRAAACEAVEKYVERMVEEFRTPMRFSSAVSNPSTTFRHDIYPDYKGNRPASGRTDHPPLAPQVGRREHGREGNREPGGRPT